MALTLTRLSGPASLGNIRKVHYRITFDSSYPAGGESLTAGDVGLSEIHKVDIDPYDAASGRLIYGYDYANSKIQVFYPSGGAGTAPTTIADPVIPSGSTAVTSTAAQPDLTPGRGKEVGSTANLAAVIVHVGVWGF